MSAEEATRFIKALQDDESLNKEMFALREMPEKAFALVKERGFNVTKDEVREAFLEYSSNALTQDQLESVAAGLSAGATAGIAVGATAGGAALGAVAVGTTVLIVSATLGSAAAAAI